MSGTRIEGHGRVRVRIALGDQQEGSGADANQPSSTERKSNAGQPGHAIMRGFDL